MDKINNIFSYKFLQPGRLIFQVPPEQPKTAPQLPKTANQPHREEEKAKTQKKTKKEGEKTSKTLLKEPEKSLTTFAKSYHHLLTAEAKEDDLEQIRRKAESNEISLIELQGGHEWLGLKGQEYEQKYGKLSKAYLQLKKDADGRESFVVKSELDRTYKTKFGIGAGHLLPPSITAIETTDLSGHRRQGKRGINPSNGKVGYYEVNPDGSLNFAKYLEIFAGYSIKPIDFIDETSQDYKAKIEEEKQNYLKNKEAMEAYEESGANTPKEVQQYIGKTNNPITSLRSLMTSEDKNLKEKGLTQKEILNVNKAKIDYLRIEALLDRFSIRLDSRTEILSGSYLMNLNGKGAQMLGWDNESTEKENDLFKTNNKKIENPEELRKWCINEAAKLVNRNSTVKLIEALQKGEKNHMFSDQEFTGGYELDLTHLDQLYKIAEDQEGFKKLANKSRGPNGKINSQKFIENLFPRLEIPQGISQNEALEYIYKNRARLGFLIGDEGQEVTLKDLVALSRNKSAISVQYRWNALAQASVYPYMEGNKCCALSVSTLLGMGNANGGLKGKEGNVRHLLARLMASNRAHTGSEGIVFGYRNYQPGDVVIFRGTKKYANRRFSHVAIVRSRLTIDGEEYLIFIDEGKNFQATIVPVNRGSSTVRHLAAALSKPQIRQSYLAKYPELRAIYAERRYVYVRNNNDWWGDASTGRGYVAFAVRTSTLTNNPPPQRPPLVAASSYPRRTVPQSPAPSQKPQSTPPELTEPLDTNIRNPEIAAILEQIEFKNIPNLNQAQVEKYFKILKTAVDKKQITLQQIAERILPKDSLMAAASAISDEYHKKLNAEIAPNIPQHKGTAYGRRWEKVLTLYNKTAPHRLKYFAVFLAYLKTFAPQISASAKSDIFKTRSVLDQTRNWGKAVNYYFTKEAVSRKGDTRVGPEILAHQGGLVIATADDWKGGSTKESYMGGGLGTPLSGNGVIILTANGEYHYYAHFSNINVHTGDFVQAGQVLGNFGDTGTRARMMGRVFHFEIRKVNPDNNKITDIDGAKVIAQVESSRSALANT